MSPTVLALLAGLAIGLGIAYILGTTGGTEALLVVLAFGAGIAAIKLGVIGG